MKTIKLAKIKTEVMQCDRTSIRVVTKQRKKEIEGSYKDLKVDKIALPQGIKRNLEITQKKELINIIKDKFFEKVRLLTEL